jgi:CIC family chloride channel protein
VVGALCAQLFTALLRFSQQFFLQWLAGYQPPTLPSEGGVLQQMLGSHGLWLIPLATAFGGLLSGLLVYNLAPETEGHGTDTAVHAFHHTNGLIRVRVPLVKLLASALTIGSGGSAGREGPTALISAGIGSAYAVFGHRPEEERRLLMLIGMAAGLAAIFRSPIGAALFAIEVLYSEMEFEAGALLYTMLASIVAYACNSLIVGWQPLFQVPANVYVPDFSEYAWYVALGVASGVVATLLPVVFYNLRSAFRALPVPSYMKPAIGGMGVGLLALGFPQVLGGGYGWVQEAIDGRLSTGLLLALLFAKTLAFALTISSGGSGGVFAPSLFVGAMAGGFLAACFHQPPAAFVVVGMVAVFGGAARVPIATLLMVTEMTGGYHLLVPATLAVMLSYLVRVTLSASLVHKSLYEAQVPTRVDSPAHHLEHLRVALSLLSKQRIPMPMPIDHVNLVTLLASGVPVDLADGKMFFMGALRPESPWVGQALRPGCLRALCDNLEIVAILREEQVLLPHPHTVLAANDQLVVITSAQATAQLGDHLAMLSP